MRRSVAGDGMAPGGVAEHEWSADRLAMMEALDEDLRVPDPPSFSAPPPSAAAPALAEIHAPSLSSSSQPPPASEAVEGSSSTIVVEGTYQEDEDGDASAASGSQELATAIARRLLALRPAWMLHTYRPDPYERLAIAFVTALDPTCAVAHFQLVSAASRAHSANALAAAVGPRLLPLVARVQAPEAVARAAAASLLADPLFHVRDDCSPLAVRISLRPIPVLLDAIRLVPGLTPTHLLHTSPLP